MHRHAYTAAWKSRRSITIPAPSTTTRFQSPGVPTLHASSLSLAQSHGHVRNVHENLEREGILKISLAFPDESSQYLHDLVGSLHRQHGHGLPISHSSSQGWFWDVRPNNQTFQTPGHQARSETMQHFPWHTDCSYEECPPRFFALQVLQPDRCGGGTLSVMKVDTLWAMLSARSKALLCEPRYRIQIPTEFIKNLKQRHITGSLFAVDPRGAQGQLSLAMTGAGTGTGVRARFREDIVEPLDGDAGSALDELTETLQGLKGDGESVLHLTPAKLPRNTIIVLDNHRWLHARNLVRDPARHLRRVRWDAKPFDA